MAIQFKNIPQALRVPLFYAEVDNSQANTSVANQRALIIGQITASGLATPNAPVLSQGNGDAMTQGGVGSHLALMTAAYRQNDGFGEVWYLPLADDPAATAATGSLLFTAAPTADGTISLYIAGTVVEYPVTASETLANVASGLVAAINSTANLPVSAAVDGANTAKVDLTAVNKGLVSNDIDLRLNYQGTAGGEATPTGLGLTITAMSGGQVNPSLTQGLLNLQEQAFDFIVCPLTDPASLNAIKLFLNDMVGRWSWETQIYGHCFYAYRGTAGALTTFGTSRNNQHESCMGFYDSPTPAFIWAAAVTGAAAVSLRADPGLPLHTLAVAGVLAPPLQSRFPLTIRNTLLYDGVSTFTVADDGTVQIEMLITTYQLNGFGQPDNSYLKVETMFLIMFVLRALATLVTSKYARVKLAADGTRFAPGSGVVTPSMIKADLIAQYASLAASGYVQNTAAFNDGVDVELNPNNPNRVDVLFPGTLIDQLDIFALLFQFRLQ